MTEEDEAKFIQAFREVISEDQARNLISASPTVKASVAEKGPDNGLAIPDAKMADALAQTRASSRHVG